MRNKATHRRCRTCVRVSNSLRKGLCSGCYQRSRRSGESSIGRACEACGTMDTRVVGPMKLRAEHVKRSLCANCRQLARPCRTIADLRAVVAEGIEVITALGIPSPVSP